MEAKITVEPRFVKSEIEAPLEEGQTITLEKIVAVATSRDFTPPAEVAEQALNILAQHEGLGYMGGLFEAHSRAWSRIWQESDVKIKGGDPPPSRVFALTFSSLSQHTRAKIPV